ncbi:MAG: AAA family ATPase [Tidjanibacter sp.]|nr:AAA family ATPase [Tidjanibacter sp.]
MTIFLVGFMGCGKSTVARGLAELSGFRYVDLDQEVCRKAQRESVAEIFAEMGEEKFRRLEREAIEHLSTEGDVVVATGGGAPCYGDNMDRLMELGVTVYLRMSADALTERLQRVRVVRPKIVGLSPEELSEYVRGLLVEREPIYNRARVVVDCDGIPSRVVISRLRYLTKKRN